MQKTRKSGLPGELNMRHDGHFVDIFSQRVTGPQIRMIPLKKIIPNPHQARSELGNIKELMNSIREKGVLEPLLVRYKDGQYEIIAGERRFIASKRIGLTEIPCIEMNVEDHEAMELALIENLQRKDLSIFEEADGINALTEMYGYTQDQIAKKIGKARSSISEIIGIGKIPAGIRKRCSEAGISSRTTLIEIAKQKSPEDMKNLIEAISKRELRREDTRELSKNLKGEAHKKKRFVFNYSIKGPEHCKLRIEFRKEKVKKEEIIRILKEVINKLEE